MGWVFINDNKVVRIENDMAEDDAMSIRHLFQQVKELSYFSRTPEVGWIYENENARPDIPSVTPRQIRQALVLYGVNMSMIESALGSLPEPHASLAKTEWEYSISFDRNRPLVKSVGQMLGWNEDQLDNLWKFAKTL